MPLSSTRTAMTLVESTPWAVALSMQIDGSEPPAFVRVVATHECIVSLDPTGAIDQDNALDLAQWTFRRFAMKSRSWTKRGVSLAPSRVSDWSPSQSGPSLHFLARIWNYWNVVSGGEIAEDGSASERKANDAALEPAPLVVAS